MCSILWCYSDNAWLRGAHCGKGDYFDRGLADSKGGDRIDIMNFWETLSILGTEAKDALPAGLRLEGIYVALQIYNLHLPFAL